jgi:hypothetical protein
MNGVDRCVLPTGIGRGGGRDASVCKGVALERSARAFLSINW